jgi:hypothetical protein
MTPEKIERNFEVCGLKLAKEATKLIVALCEYSAQQERERACQAIQNSFGLTDDEKRIAIEVISFSPHSTPSPSAGSKG